MHIFVRAVFLLLLNLPHCRGRRTVLKEIIFSRNTLKWPLRWPPCSTLQQNTHNVPPGPPDEAPSRTLICLFPTRGLPETGEPLPHSRCISGLQTGTVKMIYRVLEEHTRACIPTYFIFLCLFSCVL